MSETKHFLSVLAASVALLIPTAYALGAILAPGWPLRRLFLRGQRIAAAAIGGWLVVAVGTLAGGSGVTIAPLAPVPGIGVLPLEVRLDAVTVLVLGLVTFLAFVILRFSRAYLDGDPGRPRYLRWLLATLAAVSLLVVSGHLLVLAVAWIATGLFLHRLLTFYPERPQAQIAAHKKFLVSRLADVCILAAIALIGGQTGSLRLDDVHAWVRAEGAHPGGLQFAAVLLAVAAALKSAQLPFHGWLIQVMEAPTPVSALLHAGVVNLGGFLMIRMAPLMVEAPVAQGMLVVLGALTAVLAGLVMITRVSVKVNLAWSTCAQMGFMLVQCGLGAHSIALLHLLAHSLYKAHAFLASGSAVEVWRIQEAAPSRGNPGPGAWMGAALFGVFAVAVIGAAFGVDPSREPALWALGAILALAFTPPLVRAFAGGGRGVLFVAPAVAGMALLYFAWHEGFSGIVDASAHAATPGVLIAFTLVAFALLFAAQVLLASRPGSRAARALYPWLFAGMYLDESFTRATFRIWPPPSSRIRRPRPAVYRETPEVRS